MSADGIQISDIEAKAMRTILNHLNGIGEIRLNELMPSKCKYCALISDVLLNTTFSYVRVGERGRTDMEAAMIAYEYAEGRRDVPVRVKLAGRVVGEIRPVTGGWRYFPKRSKVGGEIFPTLNACQRSLANA